MKVFQMRHASDQYQVAWLSQHRDYSIERILAVSNFWMHTDALIGDAWTPPVAPLDPNLPEGDFYNNDPSNLITGPRATAVLYPHLARAGELLPLPYGDKMLTLLNVIPWYDMLDEEHTEFTIGETSGIPIGIRRYAFRLEGWPNVSLFKPSWHHGTQIMVVEGASDMRHEFRALVRRKNLKGLVFREIWDSEQGLQGPDVWGMPFLPA